MVSLIVSAYDRPDALRCCLVCLRTQTYCSTGALDIIVACNATDQKMQEQHDLVARDNSVAISMPSWGMINPLDSYAAAERLALSDHVFGEWIGFPSDDSYYTTNYLANMLESAQENGWDFVYSDMLHSSFWLEDGSGVSPTRTPYRYVDVSPVKKNNRYTIDKTCFLVKTELFKEIGFPGQLGGKACGADGVLAEELVRREVRHGKARGGAMCVHS